MELKNYQKAVLADLENYLEILATEKNLEATWQKYHGEELPRYKDRIKGVPNVCLKIPTGGGKTFLACASLKKIFENLPREHKTVIWLVPNDAILTQTINALQNTEHEYRQKINKDFNCRVAVYTKDELLQAQNISAASVKENLSICILSYASIRIDSRKKDVRKVYNENGALETLADYLGVENPALIEILRALNPVVIVDESHNTKSDLSVEMLQNLNPSFILELTATPKSFSNVISIVSSQTLKDAEMIKLPVIVYNPFDKETLIQSVINQRKNLEERAAAEEKYIRPIALFQAAPNTNDDAETFDKIKNDLIRAGIGEKEIAIKTANINELGDKNLQDENCQIRYIITINALKEGWDCPFAYILASLANKQSQTDVEQLVGRILRQPNTSTCTDKFLNSAYVFTCSANFGNTVEKIVQTLNGEGFTANDVKAVENSGGEENLFEEAEKQIERYDAENKNTVSSGGSGRSETVKTYNVKADFQKDVEELAIPQFFQKVPRNELLEDDLFATGETVDRLLTPENLSEGFNLEAQDKKISFDIRIDEIDIDDNKFASSTLTLDKAKEYQDLLDVQTPEEKAAFYVKEIFGELRHWKRAKYYKLQDLKKYIAEIVNNMTADELDNLNLKTLPAYIQQIKNKITALDDDYRKNRYDELIKAKKIFCKGSYKLKKSINLAAPGKTIKKSLYEAEGDMNNFESDLISKIAGLPNIVWWHRNTPQEFNLNGFINHYPDFILKLKSGKVILVETKGSHLDGEDSHEKLKLSDDWTARAGDDYDYFMVFDNAAIQDRNSFTVNKFIETVSTL